MSDLNAAMDPNPVNHLYGVSNNFHNTELLSPNQVDLRLDGFLGARLPRLIIISQWNVSALLHISIVAQS